MSAQNDAAFVKQFGMVLGGLVLFTVIIIVVANSFSDEIAEQRANDPMFKDDVASRIAPVGKVKIVGMASPDRENKSAQSASDKPAAVKSPEEIYGSVCMACHATGAAGAPKLDDKAAWQPRVDQGMDTLLQNVLNGKGAMPPKGGLASLSEAQLRSTIEFMVKKAGFDAAAQAKPAETAKPAEAMPAKAAEPAAEPPKAVKTGLDLAAGKQVYDTSCMVCHAAGIAGAPKFGDKAAWAPRIAQGAETLLHNAINGKGGMPPKGGYVHLSDGDIANAIGYMVSESQ